MAFDALVVQNIDHLRVSSLNPDDLTHGLCQKDMSSSAVETLAIENLMSPKNETKAGRATRMPFLLAPVSSGFCLNTA